MATASSAQKQIKVMRIIARMNVGGPAVQVSTLNQGMDKSLFDELLVTGICEDDETDYVFLNHLDISRVVISGLGRTVSPIDDFHALLRILKLVRKFKPDIVHTHTFKAGLLGRVASIISLQKHIRIHTYHGHLLHGYFSGYRLTLLVALEKLLAKFTDVLVAVGGKVKSDLLDVGIGRDSQYRVIPPGFLIPKKFEDASSPRPYATRLSDFSCLWLGRIVDIKCPNRIIEIARELKNQNLPITIRIVGDGSLRAHLQEIVNQENLKVEFLGWRQDIYELILESDLLILTSKNEGTPISIVEAQRLGRPVIATDVGSVKEVLINGQTGFAKDYSPEVFCDLIEMLRQSNETYVNFAESAKKFSRSKFSDSRLISDHEELYLSTLRK